MYELQFMSSDAFVFLFLFFGKVKPFGNHSSLLRMQLLLKGVVTFWKPQLTSSDAFIKSVRWLKDAGS